MKEIKKNVSNEEENMRVENGRTSLVAQMVKNPPVMWETWVRSLGWEGMSCRRAWQPLQYSCLENPHGQRSLADCSP